MLRYFHFVNSFTAVRVREVCCSSYSARGVVTVLGLVFKMKISVVLLVK